MEAVGDVRLQLQAAELIEDKAEADKMFEASLTEEIWARGKEISHLEGELTRKAAQPLPWLAIRP
jgi:uncharacterized protein YbaP (TraB family)